VNLSIIDESYTSVISIGVGRGHLLEIGGHIIVQLMIHSLFRKLLARQWFVGRFRGATTTIEMLDLILFRHEQLIELPNLVIRIGEHGAAFLIFFC
jgi:hypothetical protein